MTKLYIDTNILVYAIEDSKNPYGKDISSSSSDLFWAAASCKFHVIISDWALEELSRIKTPEEIEMLFKIVEKKIIKIRHTPEDIQRAKEQNPDHFQDELHGILAIRAEADYLVTRNVKDFLHLENRIKVVRPEDLLESKASS